MFLATDPQYQRQGAGTFLIEWGVSRCEKERVPAYLESTQNAMCLYMRAGFEVLFDIEMEISYDWEDEGVIEEDYKEIAMEYRPGVPRRKKSTVSQHAGGWRCEEVW